MFLNKDDHKVSIIGSLLLLGLTLTTGLTVYNAMRQQIETVLGRGLTGSLEGKALLFETRILKGIEDTRALALRPFIIQFMEELNNDINNKDASNNLTRNVHSLTQIGFSAAVVYDSKNNILSQVGTFTSKENPTIQLNTEGDSNLIWDNVIILKTSVDVFNHGNKIGKIITETKLPNLTRSFMDIHSTGKSVEFLICAKMPENRMVVSCLISNPSTVRFTHLDVNTDVQRISSKGLALIGKSGVASTHDYRDIPVIEAYTSLPTLGILMTLKLDRDELFMPINDKLKDSTLYLVALIIAEILLLNWFINKLRKSEKEAHNAKVKAEEYSIELTSKEMELRKRLNEITCLYEIRREMELEMSISEVCHKIFKHLIPALQFPNTSFAEILISDKRYTSQDYSKKANAELELAKKTEIIKSLRPKERKSIFNIFIQSNIYIDNTNQGYLRVYYANDVPESFVEEQKLIDAIASDLEGWIELRQLEESLISISEEQIHKIGQELHDNIGQQIAAIAYQASALEFQVHEKDTPHKKISELAASIASQTQNLVANIKQLSKVLLPFELETSGLTSALQTLAAKISATYNINCKFINHIENEKIENVIALNLYRVAQEAINNALFHGKARNITVSLTINELDEKFIHLTISDDGTGFSDSTEHFFSGMGIKIMHYRAKQLNGKLTILKRNEGGVEVNFLVPIYQGDK